MKQGDKIKELELRVKYLEDTLNKYTVFFGKLYLF